MPTLDQGQLELVSLIWYLEEKKSCVHFDKEGTVWVKEFAETHR